MPVGLTLIFHVISAVIWHVFGDFENSIGYQYFSFNDITFGSSLWDHGIRNWSALFFYLFFFYYSNVLPRIAATLFIVNEKTFLPHEFLICCSPDRTSDIGAKGEFRRLLGIVLRKQKFRFLFCWKRHTYKETNKLRITSKPNKLIFISLFGVAPLFFHLGSIFGPQETKLVSEREDNAYF